MAKPKNKDKQIKLKEKREAERERYRRIMADPEKRKLMQEKEKLKYARKKERKIVLSIGEMTPRQQRKQRKSWRENTRRHRGRQKSFIRMQEFLDVNTPPGSDVDDVTERQHQEQQNSTPRMIAARRRALRNRKQRSRLMKKKDEEIEKLKRKVQQYKARYSRIKQKQSQPTQKTVPTSDLSPRSRVKELLVQEKQKPEKVKKKLLFAESLKEQLTENYKCLRSDKDKQVFKKIVGGKVLKKYRVENQCSPFLKGRSFPLSSMNQTNNILSYQRKKKIVSTDFIAKIKKEVRDFLELDINSRVCPGKKDYVTKNKLKIQKRFLNDSLKNLHRSFVKTHAYISYRSFCRFKPFYILQMKAANRETCKCVIHANFEFIVTSLFKLGVIKEKTSSDAVKTLCCLEKTERCLFKTCDRCKDNKIVYAKFDESVEGTFFKWESKRVVYRDPKTKKEKTVTKIVKEKYTCRISEIITAFENYIPKYLAHEGNVTHQFRALHDLKEFLQPNDCLIHMDFSENYTVKYAEETQGFHFGGSRQQISLHTVVLYFSVGGVTKNKCFCSLSESLLHGPPAIWAHLRPIFHYISTMPNIDTIHFLSDSPATQYRNKTMFNILAVHFKVFCPQVVSSTYNYSETGHGKGAPDGIGGVCKRTADRVVEQGKDVSTIEKLVEVLREHCKGISLFVISDQDIAEVTSIVEAKDTIKPFVGCMQVHQVVGTPETGVLRFRKLSCFRCGPKTFCSHYEIGNLRYEIESSEEPSDESISITPSTSNKNTRLRYSEAYSSDEDDSILPNKVTAKNIKKGRFLLTSFVTNNKTQYR